jgi:AcrR family transcriptional regulator
VNAGRDREERGRDEPGRDEPAVASSLRDAAEAITSTERRQDGRTVALGPRAERTRRKLIDSAEAVFREKGYLNTSVSEIAERAGVSIPTFYQYFSDRSDIVAVMVADMVKEMLRRGVSRWDPRTGRMGLRRVIAPYVDGYRRHREFFDLWQTVAQVDDRMRALYRDYRQAYLERFGSLLDEGVRLGLVRSDLDPLAMARAMTILMERYCHDVFVLAPSDPLPDDDEVTDLLTTLWADAINLVEAKERPHR